MIYLKSDVFAIYTLDIKGHTIVSSVYNKQVSINETVGDRRVANS